MRWLLAVVLVLCAGCGSETDRDPYQPPDGTTTPPLDQGVVGNWIVIRETSASAYTFTTGGQYASSVLAVVGTGNTLNGEIETGTYETTPARKIVFTPIDSTCPISRQRYQVGYARSGAFLTVEYSDAIVIFEINNAPPVQATLILGCFDRVTGAFTQHPRMPVGP
jgi:hypothetical protein